ncbi:MAG TPA: aminotransferase class IV [Terriglobia bacterium]|nr:aminotransferase class IV [Terriglobia bacterium]
MIICLNGAFVPEEKACVSVLDRGFLYGDGLFETLLLRSGRPFRWEAHVARFEQGARLLGIAPPAAGDDLRAWVARLVELNGMPDAIARIALTRGVGLRGYSPRGAAAPTLVITLHPAPVVDVETPVAWRLHCASLRVAETGLPSALKTSSKVAHVLARAEAEAAGADEALLLNTRGEVVEAAAANLFWIENATVMTPPLSSGALAGVTREAVMELCRKQQWALAEADALPGRLLGAEAVFLTLTSLGIVEAVSLDGRPLKRCARVHQLHRAYQDLLRQEP